jgi:hypothetical protein
MVRAAAESAASSKRHKLQMLLLPFNFKTDLAAKRE